jgi:hypothetical protein
LLSQQAKYQARRLKIDLDKNPTDFLILNQHFVCYNQTMEKKGPVRSNVNIKELVEKVKNLTPTELEILRQIASKPLLISPQMPRGCNGARSTYSLEDDDPFGGPGDLGSSSLY